MRALEDLKQMLHEELQKIVKKGDITPMELENVYKVVDIMKDIETITAMEEAGYSEEYSRNYRDGSSYDGRSGRDGDGDGRYSEEGNSYARRRRDSRGRYMSGGSSYEGNYRDGGYSGHESKEQMIMKLESMMDQVSGKEREAIQRCIEQLER